MLIKLDIIKEVRKKRNLNTTTTKKNIISEITIKKDNKKKVKSTKS
jgi:hypothetical protein